MSPVVPTHNHPNKQKTEESREKNNKKLATHFLGLAFDSCPELI